MFWTLHAIPSCSCSVRISRRSRKWSSQSGTSFIQGRSSCDVYLQPWFRQKRCRTSYLFDDRNLVTQSADLWRYGKNWWWKNFRVDLYEQIYFLMYALSPTKLNVPIKVWLYKLKHYRMGDGKFTVTFQKHWNLQIRCEKSFKKALFSFSIVDQSV